MSRVPRIRFKGFEEDWEQCKLGEMCSLITKGTTPLDKSSVGTINFVKIESIDEASGEIKITQKITDEEHNSYLRRSQLKENDILFSIAGTLGRVTSVKLDILPANTNQALAIIRLKSGCLQYIKTYLKGKAVADFIKKNPTIGAQPNLSLEQVGNLEIALPTEKEQALVGAYFESLDNLITLHQSKYFGHILKVIVSCALYWEQRKLGECFTERIESMPNGELISVTINDGIKKFSELGRHDNSNEDKSKYKKVCIGDIAYNSMRMWQGASGYSPYNGIVSPAYTVLLANEGVNSKCIAYQFKLPGMIHAFQINSQGITSDNWNLKFQALSDITIYISRSIDEQGKIAVLLESIDRLITLHQLEPYKLILKAIAYRIIDYAESKLLSSIK
ncbi:MAG: restriction endonuclease subunit S [Lachnoanaerobaculum sp.]|nr:restriction endonuclease subunit S [Lachnoanaerobaculum sp.]